VNGLERDGDQMPFAERLQRAREALNSPPAVAQGSEDHLSGEGEAADGRVRAVAVTGGRIDTVELDPRVLRLSPEELAGHIGTALNGALDSLRERASARGAGQVDAPDPAALLERLGEVQNEGLRRLGVMTRGINEALAGIQDRAHVSGDAGLHGLEDLLDRLSEVVRPIAGESVPGTATGTAADGRVSVVASTGGRIEEVSLDPGVLRRASHELAAHLAGAANEALEKARALAAERLATVANGDLREQVRALQDQSIEQMGAMTGSLTALMNSIRKR
jgi:DNA-binding protein YbaB